LQLHALFLVLRQLLLEVLDPVLTLLIVLLARPLLSIEHVAEVLALLEGSVNLLHDPQVVCVELVGADLQISLPGLGLG
jgi:hypothetical protein